MQSLVYLRNLPNSQQLPFPDLRNLTRIEALPGIILNQPYPLQDLRSQSHTLISDPNHLLPLRKHNLDEDELDGEPEDEDA